MEKPYFSTSKPRLLAHRGLSQHKQIDENTLEAFSEALLHGATHLESDTQSTSDGHAVLFHDDDLSRVAGLNIKVSELSLRELQEITLSNGGRIPTLREALSHFPSAFFNLDIKTKAAIEPTILSIEELGAHDRVLISSFSNPVRKSALKRFSKPVATSGSVSVAIAAWASHTIFFGLGFNQILRQVDALQVPPSRGFVKFASKSFIQRAKASNTEVHFWTINDPVEMEELLSIGADGIVSDRVDLFKLGNR